jgi:hypothetical protein
VARRIDERDVATGADAILKAAKNQDYSECEFTLKELSRQA